MEERLEMERLVMDLQRQLNEHEQNPSKLFDFKNKLNQLINGSVMADEAGTNQLANNQSVPHLNNLNTDINYIPKEMFQMILKKLDLESLKACRLVCKYWNTQAIPVLSDCSVINIKKCLQLSDEDEDETEPIFPQNISIGLIKNIKHFASFYDLKLFHQWNSTALFCEKYGAEVEGLVAYPFGNFVDGNLAIPFLHRILTQLCPNLEHLIIYDYFDLPEDENERNEPKHDMFNMLKFTNPLKLKYICFKGTKGKTLDISKTKDSYLKKMICASKELHSLDIEDISYCPTDFSNNAKLTNLFFPFLSFSNLKDMKNPFWSNLDSLTLNAARDDKEDKPFNNNIELSQLRKLKILPMEEGHPNLAFIILGKAPILESLSVFDKETNGNYLYEPVFKQLFQIGNCYLNVHTLELGDFKDQQLFESVVNVATFPNLTSLKFVIAKNVRMKAYPKVNTLGQWFKEVFSKLDLKQLDLTIKCKFKLSYLAKAISKSPCFLAGLEKLTILNSSHKIVDDLHRCENRRKFEAFLQMLSNLKEINFFNFHMEVTNSVKLLEFIKLNNLPVTLGQQDDAIYDSDSDDSNSDPSEDE